MSEKSETFFSKTISKKWIFWGKQLKHSKEKDFLLLANKLIEKILDPRNAKEHYQSFIRKENIKQ